MKNKLVPVLFIAACLWSAWWAFDLIGIHHDTVAGLESGRCQDGGCGAVLQSEWSELFGIPVSTPAVPMYFALALLGVLALAGTLTRQVVSRIAVAATGAGVVFGGWLLFNMLFYVDSVCKFCLIMDASNVGVLVLGALLHPAGLAAPFRELLQLVKQPKEHLAPALLLLLAVLIGTPVINGATRPLSSEAPTPPPLVQEATPAPAATPSAAASQPTAPPGAPKPGTRRLVLPEEVVQLALPADVPRRGPKNAPVEVVVFEDFQCPFCKKLSGNVEILMEELPGEVKLAFMHFPMHQACNETELKKNLHNFACNAARAAVCAQEQGKFWEMHDTLFRNNNRLRNGNLSSYAREIGLDVKAWADCVRDDRSLARVKADSKIGGDAGVTGTPALFVNGRRLIGAQPVASLKAAVKAVQEQKEGRVLLDVEQEGETIGPVTGPATVSLRGPNGPFTIDAFEASIEGGKAVSKPGVEPARSATWYDAKDACEAAGKRLCTEAEWLTACTGTIPVDDNKDGVFSKDRVDGREYSYGAHWREGWCADSRAKTDPTPLLTGNHPKCRTPEGVYDLEGVTKEWIGLTPDKAALKGGSYFSGNSARCMYYKDDESPEAKDDSIGFRCCSGEGVAGVIAAAEDRFPGGKVGDTIQEWSGPLVGGGTLSMKDLRGGPVIMTFWATWCEPCKAELPALAEIYETYKAQGLTVIGVNVDSNPAKTKAFLKKSPLPFPVVLDPDKAIMDRFEGEGVPTTFWVRKDGVIRQRSVGYEESAKPKVLGWVQDLLQD